MSIIGPQPLLAKTEYYFDHNHSWLNT